MKSILTTAGLLIALGVLIWLPLYAAETGTISATVTATNVAVTVEDGTIAFGQIALSSTASTTADGVNQSQYAINQGNVSSTLNVKTSHAVGGTQWSVASSIGVQDEFMMQYSTTSGSIWFILDTYDTYETCSSFLVVHDTSTLDFAVYTPSDSTDYVEKTITLTAQVVGN